MVELDNKKIAQIIASFQIPVKPAILTEIQHLMEQDEPDIEKIANVISTDVGLSAAILKTINSPFYGMSREISGIKQAVLILGLRTINGLVIALLLKASFKGSASISLERFWDDAVDVANAITYLGNYIKKDVPLDMLYSVGLFHDCGVLLLALKYKEYDKTLLQAAQEKSNSINIEQRLYETNHAILGYYVATTWNLPEDICQLILHHHDHNYLKQSIDPQLHLIYALLIIANNIVAKVKHANESPDWQMVREDVLTMVGFTLEDYEDLENEFIELL